MSGILTFNTGDYKDWITSVRAGDMIKLSGTVYTARDAAHKRIAAMMDAGEPLPFELDGAFIYYAGPTPSKPGQAIGSCGPTTSSRMDKFTPRFIECGQRGMIGKGKRSDEVKAACVGFGAIYLCAVGGAGALASRCITSCEVIAFDELGCESVKRLVFDSFPLYVAYDTVGGDIFIG